MTAWEYRTLVATVGIKKGITADAVAILLKGPVR